MESLEALRNMNCLFNGMLILALERIFVWRRLRKYFLPHQRVPKAKGRGKGARGKGEG